MFNVERRDLWAEGMEGDMQIEKGVVKRFGVAIYTPPLPLCTPMLENKRIGFACEFVVCPAVISQNIY